jgi:UDP-3-O-[3-hydroxymyristoyl] N-acetylglucosamine deacetylase / 3-hydroxyacyl-[acyl-carrier-protein] dehydratase
MTAEAALPAIVPTGDADAQRTLSGSATVSGRGLFLGHPASVTFHGAPAGHGVVFVRTDMGNARIPATVRNVVKRARRTTIRSGEATVDTLEHCMSALSGLGIDNVLVEIDGPELPALDGSARPYVEALLKAGIESQPAPRRPLVITEPIVEYRGDAMVAAMPGPKPYMEVGYDLDYGQTCALGRQLRVFDCNDSNQYVEQIAPARTFVLESEAAALRAAGMGTHLTPQDVLVLGDDGPIGGNQLRFDDEPVRHKIVDLIGDLYLLGAPIHGKIIAYKSGHSLNHALVRRLVKLQQRQRRDELTRYHTALDIRRLSRILPHRYPMLLVDRVTHVEGNRRVVGIKNVTINEPFFQGHYPGAPIMPGVLIVEAMAQISGVLIGQNLEHTGKLAVLLSLDRVKLRRPVTPGDQLVLEAEAIRIRSRIAHVRCRAYVADDLAAEAEVKFMLVDDEQE